MGFWISLIYMPIAHSKWIMWVSERCVSTEYCKMQSHSQGREDWLMQDQGRAMPELLKMSLHCHQKLPYLLSPLAGAVHWGAWGLRVHQPGRPHRCSPLHCSSSRSPAALGGTYWLGWCCCCAAPEAGGARTRSPSCSRCLRKCCARRRQIQSRTQYPFLGPWNWKDLLCCCAFEETRTHGRSAVTAEKRKDDTYLLKHLKQKCMSRHYHRGHWPEGQGLDIGWKETYFKTKRLKQGDNFFQPRDRKAGRIHPFRTRKITCCSSAPPILAWSDLEWLGVDNLLSHSFCSKGYITPKNNLTLISVMQILIYHF